MKEGCKTCKFNRERNLKQKTCLKGYRAVFGYGCKEYQKEEELKGAVKDMQERLKEIKWTGWIIKSAIEEETYLENRRLD